MQRKICFNAVSSPTAAHGLDKCSLKRAVRCSTSPLRCAASVFRRTASIVQALRSAIFAVESRRDPVELADNDSIFCNIDGVNVHYKHWKSHAQCEGDCIDEAFMAAHGFGSSLFSYEAFLPFLLSLREASCAVAFDSPGFGLTSRPPITALRKYQPSFGATIISALAPHQASKFILVGFSMGARSIVAAALCSNSPTPHALILIAPALVPESKPQGLFGRVFFVLVLGRLVLAYIAVLLTVILNPLLQVIIRLAVNGVTFWINGLRFARGNPSTLTQTDLEGYRRPLAVKDWTQGILHFTRAAILESCSPAKSYSVEQLQSRLPSIPILIVHGASDRIIPVSNSHALHAALPASQLKVLPGVGHLPHEGSYF